MADEALRMRAEVVDAFSGPLKSLRSQLLDVSRQGASHGETLAKGMGKAEAAIQTTARSATTILNPALATVGITGLTAGAAVAGVAMSLNKLSSNLSSLGALSRETGVAAGTLQTFGAVARKFGLEQDAVAAGTKTFAGNMREFGRGIGETYQWINRQGTDAAGRKAFQDFAQDIRGTTDEGEKLRKSLEFMETIRNPVERGIFAQHVFGNSDFGRIADGHLGKLADVWNAQKQRLGPLDPKAILQAEKFEQAIADLRTSMQTIGTTIAREVLPFASEFTQWVDGIAKDQRGDFVKGLRGGLQDIARELNAIDWKSAGDSAKQMLLSTTALVKPLADDIKEIAAAIRSFNEGKYVEAFRHLDGGSGPLARKLAPLPGDDVLAKQDRLDQMKGQLQNFEAAQKIGPVSDRSREQADRLRREMEKLTEEIRALRQKDTGDATAQKSSADGDGPFAGARIQSAAYTGGGGFGRMPGLGRGANLPGGGSGPGYSGEQGPAGGGGRFNGLGASRPSVAPIGPRPDVSPADPSGGYVGNDGRRAAGGRLTDAGRARIASWMEFLQRPVAEGGLGMSKGKAMADIAMMQGESRLNLDPDAMGDHDANKVPHAFGTAQWSDAKGNPRFPLLKKFAGSQGKPWTDLGVQQQYHRMEMLGLPGAVSHRRAYDAMMAAPTDEQTLREGISKYENPQKYDLAYQLRKPFLDRLRRDQAGATAGRLPSLAGDVLPNGAPRVLKPNSMKDAPGLTMEDANRLRGGQADGEGWAAREKARKAFEAMQQGEGRLDASAGRAGVVAGPKVENNGSVVVNVQKAGPDAKVTTSATGRLFRDIVQNHGRQMAKAE
ncbi:phage tail tip lysozyme [Methylobacterium sp. J-001]|uniref:phage tail tip lysozyme n=1 Tax=Methylobacterium sp. J-001 TaxID=2836609 RepID=UPI001FB999A0|nr:phage tail tip lysozyme [Methylobacterium sp. J-001]MCJ2117246.1 phage tail tip lysozyme [Methylobacterium sp. J-001]